MKEILKGKCTKLKKIIEFFTLKIEKNILFLRPENQKR